jgi:signal peptide peptidase SppA
MRFQRIIEQVYFRPWYITPAAHFAIHRILSAHLDRKAGEDDGMSVSDLFVSRPAAVITDQKLAIIHAKGPLGKGLSKMEKTCGATDYADLRAEISGAIEQGARGILLQVDSPGGTVLGTREVAAQIASSPVPVVVYTEDIMASAAYYLSAGASRIFASPSAMVGSIGVYIPWMDYADQLKAMGLKPDPIINTGGDLKALGFSGTLSRIERDHLQAEVDRDFALFRAHVLQFRGVPDSAMRGQVLSGEACLEAGLVDELGDFAAAYSDLLDRAGGPLAPVEATPTS